MAAPSPSSHLLHVLRSHPSISSSSSSFLSLLKPLFLHTSNAVPKSLTHIRILPLSKTLFPSISPHLSNPLFSQSFSSPAVSVPRPHFSALGVGDAAENSSSQEDEEIEQDGEESGIEKDDVDNRMSVDSDVSPLERNREERLKLPSLTVKERKELASYAHSLGKKLKSQLVGKSGVTSNLATSFIETLEANELLKIKIHRTCPGELEDVVKQLEEATGSVTVGQIGRTVIIYRPSLTKLKAEEKKKASKLFLRKQLKPKLSKEQESKFSRRRSSWKQ
ncbi:putative RNA-binding protein YqeI [Senna tora]|uniref:Putative RNA-binding protein YqeI n=1 Tax=Senna tora TaxID=362788 RepID=A0A834SXT8_9FABA|nr:putative RNA-binding protein YqeI [Senna tora]